jgi:hypothetical protein
MFSNQRDIEYNDIIMFHTTARGRIWLGVVVNQVPLDNKEVFVRWWFEDKQEWSEKQRIPMSMLYLIGPVPEWAEL